MKLEGLDKAYYCLYKEVWIHPLSENEIESYKDCNTVWPFPCFEWSTCSLLCAKGANPWPCHFLTISSRSQAYGFTIFSLFMHKNIHLMSDISYHFNFLFIIHSSLLLFTDQKAIFSHIDLKVLQHFIHNKFSYPDDMTQWCFLQSSTSSNCKK